MGRSQDFTGAILTETSDDIFDKIHVGAIDEQFGVFIFRRLEEAERGVIRAVDDLDVLHAAI